jgi:predicted RNA-binding Zn-ribbon protein involved in translation (DUF1610 family)
VRRTKSVLAYPLQIDVFQGAQMIKGKCPKCSSQEIYVSEDGGGIGGHSYFYLEVKNDGSPNSLQWQTYLCADCGYYENYLLDKQKIAKIKANPKKEKWKKLSG